MKRKIDLVLTIFSLTFLMTGCGMSEEAKAVQAAIDALPASYSVSEDEHLAETEDQFDHLSAEDQAKVKAEKLLDLKQAKEDYIKNEVEKINMAIAGLDLKPEDEGDLDKSAEVIYADDLERSAEEIDAIVSLIQNLPAEEQYDINYEVLKKKAYSYYWKTERKYVIIKTDRSNIMFSVYETLNTWMSDNINFGDLSANSKMQWLSKLLVEITRSDMKKGADAAKALADVHMQMYEIQQQISDETVTEDEVAAIDTLQDIVETNRIELKTALEELQDMANKDVAYEEAFLKWCESFQKIVSLCDSDESKETMMERLQDLLSLEVGENLGGELCDDLQDLLSRYDSEFDEYGKNLQRKKELISDMIEE